MKSEKTELRRKLRLARRAHVAALEDTTRALLFRRPPAPLIPLLSGNIIGIYSATPHEAPAAGYARYFAEQGWTVALPRFAHRGAPMVFARHTDPFGESDLEIGPFGVLQPAADAQALKPGVLFVPLLGFTQDGARIGQGGGHYDRYFAAHPDAVTIGLAWDAQLVEQMPIEEHDMRMNYVVTPTRLYGPF